MEVAVVVEVDIITNKRKERKVDRENFVILFYLFDDIRVCYTRMK